MELTPMNLDKANLGTLMSWTLPVHLERECFMALWGALKVGSAPNFYYAKDSATEILRHSLRVIDVELDNASTVSSFDPGPARDRAVRVVERRVEVQRIAAEIRRSFFKKLSLIELMWLERMEYD